MRDAAGIVLAGGRSTRMGTAKAALEWHGSTLLRRATGILSRVVDGPVIVVRAEGQDLPELAGYVEVVCDPEPDLGPLQGIAAGLSAVADRASHAFVCSTDMPFLHPAFVRALLRTLHKPGEPEIDVALPIARGFPQPLAAAYGTALAPLAIELVNQRQLRPALLFEQCRVAQLDHQELLAADPILAVLDPDLDSVLNINEPAGYRAARARPAPEIMLRRFGTLAAGKPMIELVRAATVARAAAVAGLMLDDVLAVALNGNRIEPDGHTPLVTGDMVYFVR